LTTVANTCFCMTPSSPSPEPSVPVPGRQPHAIAAHCLLYLARPGGAMLPLAFGLLALALSQRPPLGCALRVPVIAEDAGAADADACRCRRKVAAKPLAHAVTQLHRCPPIAPRTDRPSPPAAAVRRPAPQRRARRCRPRAARPRCRVAPARGRRASAA